jgi:hypothetical protein
MFSNAKQFFKKNKLMIIIVLAVLIIITLYFLYVNVKEGFGFEQPTMPVKAKLIPVSTMDKIYNQLPNQSFKDILSPIIALYKLFLANYNDAFKVSLQIQKANQAATVNIKDLKKPTGSYSDPNYQALQEAYYAKKNENAQLRQQAIAEILPTYAPQVNPGVERVLINASKWLPTAKEYYDKFVSSNYYGLFDGTFIRNNFGDNEESARKEFLKLAIMVLNTLWEDDQLSILLGPGFSKTNPVNPPFKMPITDEGEELKVKTSMSPDLFTKTGETFKKYAENLISPFMIIAQYVAMESMNNPQGRTMIAGMPVDGLISNTIIKMIKQLNDSLANGAKDKARIGQLTSNLNKALANDLTDQTRIGELTSNLDKALANDLTDQATITNLQARVDNYDSQITTKQLEIDALQQLNTAQQQLNAPPGIKPDMKFKTGLFKR